MCVCDAMMVGFLLCGLGGGRLKSIFCSTVASSPSPPPPLPPPEPLRIVPIRRPPVSIGIANQHFRYGGFDSRTLAVIPSTDIMASVQDSKRNDYGKLLNRLWS